MLRHILAFLLCFAVNNFFVEVIIKLHNKDGILKEPFSAEAVSCYKCESYRDYRCLDPFDYQPHIQVNCDQEPFVRDRKPVFCEKTTDLIDGVYVTTRGCSSFQWEDVDTYFDIRNQPTRCFRKGLLERCLCQYDGCNSSTIKQAHPLVLLSVLFIALKS